MTIPRHTIRAICDLLGLDPNNTAAVAINGIDATITTIDWNGGALTEVTHRIQEPDPLRKPPWRLQDNGKIHADGDNPPLFIEAAVQHNNQRKIESGRWNPHDSCDGTGCWCRS